MATRYIYIAEELNNKLKEETNASALICKLLNEHYSLNVTDTENLKQLLEKKKEENKNIIEIKEKEIETIVGKIEIQEKTEEELQKIRDSNKQKQIDRMNNCVKNTKEIFGIDITTGQASEFLNGNYTTIKEYLEKNGNI